MSRSLRLLETSLVSAFVSFGVAAAVLHATEPGPGVGASGCRSQDVLAPLLRQAIDADARLFSEDTLEELETSRVEGLYARYAAEHEQLARGTTVEWARTRADALRQLREDLAEMKKLEEQAMALEALERQQD